MQDHSVAICSQQSTLMTPVSQTCGRMTSHGVPTDACVSQALPVVTRLLCPPEMPLTMSEPIGMSAQACTHLLLLTTVSKYLLRHAALLRMTCGCIALSLRVQACSPAGSACLQARCSWVIAEDVSM